MIVEDLNNILSSCARDYFSELYSEFVELDLLIAKYEARILAMAKNHEDCKRLLKIPGVGPLTATAIVAHVGNASHFKNGRDFSAYLGLTPKEHSSGGQAEAAWNNKAREYLSAEIADSGQPCCAALEPHKSTPGNGVA